MRALAVTLFTLLLSVSTLADSRAEIERKSTAALDRLRASGDGVDELLGQAAGVLVFPDVVKVGFGGAEEYGEGCLMIAGKPVAYYASAGASYGLPLGVRTKSEVVLFMDKASLEAFRSRAEWEVGADGEVTLVRAAAGGSVDGATAGEPILAFIFTEEGLAGGLTLDGARFTRLAR
jgi:lipid-binding SYLF domain-containing protein